MLRKVLVANRGEIACRIIRSLKKMGIESVAIYHDEDRRAAHVGLADESYALAGRSAGAAYLDQHLIINIARSAGCDAVHPGYGFLSENAQFAEAVTKAKITFIGPEARVIHLMGDKISSREFAEANGVPVAPSAIPDDNLDRFVASVEAIGFPLLIKAAAGGGGKGMKIVRTLDALAEAVRIASSEAERWFGDGRIYAERLVEMPRHIEVQILGDSSGNVIHLFERECSLQRRYQKIVEESPAPNLPSKVRERICETAVQLAKAAGYTNAGTVEFILGKDNAFYFLEMNTRLQVEHPVTEMVLDLDIVAEQVRIASGQPLSVSQGDIVPRGHAIECRICAEKPEADFQPATGRIGILRWPDRARIDSGIVEGQTISPVFDSMLAKVIAHGATRTEAADRMTSALHELVILGVPTNVDYLSRLMGNAKFLSGHLHTGLLSEIAGELVPAEEDLEAKSAALMAGMMTDNNFRRVAFEVPEPYASIGAWSNSA